MTWSPDGTTTGGAQTNLTSPTYTVTSDISPVPNARQHVVTALGGTQTDVRTSTAGDPFTMLIKREPYKAIPPKNPVTGSYGNVPLNRVALLIRKGVKIDSSGTIRVMNLRVISEIPAGAESADAANIRAACSLLIGQLNEESADYGDSLVTGII